MTAWAAVPIGVAALIAAAGFWLGTFAPHKGTRRLGSPPRLDPESERLTWEAERDAEHKWMAQVTGRMRREAPPLTAGERAGYWASPESPALIKFSGEITEEQVAEFRARRSAAQAAAADALPGYITGYLKGAGFTAHTSRRALCDSAFTAGMAAQVAAGEANAG